MPIQRPSALDVFTDREELIAAFERNLEHKQPQDHRVLVFHGDGGIGKTTLLQKLEQLYRQRCPQALIGRLDLAGADTLAARHKSETRCAAVGVRPLGGPVAMGAWGYETSPSPRGIPCPAPL